MPNYHLFMDLVFPCFFEPTILDQFHLLSVFPCFLTPTHFRSISSFECVQEYLHGMQPVKCLLPHQTGYNLFRNQHLSKFNGVAVLQIGSQKMALLAESPQSSWLQREAWGRGLGYRPALHLIFLTHPQFETIDEKEIWNRRSFGEARPQNSLKLIYRVHLYVCK